MMFNSLWGNKPYRATDMPLQTNKEDAAEDSNAGIQPPDHTSKQEDAVPDCANGDDNVLIQQGLGTAEETLSSWWNYTATYTNKLKESAQNYSKISAAKLGETVNKDTVTTATNNIGSYFNSMYNGIKTSVENIQKDGIPLLSEFDVEQQKFMKMQQRRQGAAVPPWVGYNEEEKMKKQILSLSMDERNVLREPPAGVDFEFDLESYMPVAWAMLETDTKLNDLRFRLVPKVIKEDKFWRNYFYRVSLIKQSSQLASLEKPVKTEAVVPESEELCCSPPPPEEFISDHLSDYDETHNLSEEELKQIGLKKDKQGQEAEKETNEKDDEWEAELARELQDFDMVEDANAGLDTETFEAELAEMLENQ